MKIEALHTYPIKSLRAHALSTAELTDQGFAYDRRFMLLKTTQDSDGNTFYKNMAVAHDPLGVLFFPTLHQPSSPDARDGRISVLFQPPADSGKESSELEIPLEPDVDGLEEVQVVMHGSSTTAYCMPTDPYGDWFSTHFGHEVLLAYLGSNTRPVLMSTPSSLAPKPTATATGSWLSTLTSTATSLLPGKKDASDSPPQITFADCAPYLVASTTSLSDLQTRLPAGSKADITKFRPNIILSGAPSPWEEDRWSDLIITNSAGRVRITTPHNCVRCKSVNIDYATGAPGTGPEGKMLALMQKDRRVDKGGKWSPVFGRYAFLVGGGEGTSTVGAGDEVEVVGWNEGGTTFDWPGLTTA